MSNEIKVYISHPIMGIKGEKATKKDMVDNNLKASTFGAILVCEFPKVDFYTPGDHDEFVMIAYESGIFTIDQILDIDCQILSKRHILLNYVPDGYISKGMMQENIYAQTHGIPILIVKDIESAKEILNKALIDLRG